MRGITRRKWSQKVAVVAVVLLLASLPVAALAAWSTDPAVNNPICTATDDQRYTEIVSDGSGGAFITWRDSRNGVLNDDIYARRVNSSGNVLWAANVWARFRQRSGTQPPEHHCRPANRLSVAGLRPNFPARAFSL